MNCIFLNYFPSCECFEKNNVYEVICFSNTEKNVYYAHKNNIKPQRLKLHFSMLYKFCTLVISYTFYYLFENREMYYLKIYINYT